MRKQTDERTDKRRVRKGQREKVSEQRTQGEMLMKKRQKENCVREVHKRTTREVSE